MQWVCTLCNMYSRLIILHFKFILFGTIVHTNIQYGYKHINISNTNKYMTSRFPVTYTMIFYFSFLLIAIMNIHTLQRLSFLLVLN